MRAGATVVFDGDCGFCTWSAKQLRRWVKPNAEIIAWQYADLAELGLTQAQCQGALQWVPAVGNPVAGGRAVAAALGSAGPAWAVIGRWLSTPGISSVVDRGYLVIAANRHRLPGSTPACAAPGP